MFPLTFYSILFANKEDEKEVLEAPDFFNDLNLDQIVEAITAGRNEYNLKPFFYTSLNNIEAICYRHEIMQDLENEVIFEQIKRFGINMQAMRDHLARSQKLHYKHQQEAWFLDAVVIYCDAVTSLTSHLNQSDLKSRGLLDFRKYIGEYCQSDRFRMLLTETKKLKADLSTIQYCVLIEGNRNRIRKNAVCIEVRKYEGEIDYSDVVEQTFSKFQQGAVKDYRVNYSTSADMNHVEAGILDLVAQLYPDTFLTLDHYCQNNRNYIDKTLEVFDREIQFYLAYLEYILIFKQAGYKFCYPQITDKSKEVFDYDGFDLALAHKLFQVQSRAVCNDFYLRDQERILVVSGPNQGGKTTFARTFGQLHHLASLGCSVPGREAQLFLFDKLFTHFEKEENIQNLSGKLQDDLVRINHILSRATSRSIIIMNEIFTSTTLLDAVFLSKQIMTKINQLDLLCVCVTFIDEIASFGEKTVSMVSTVDPENLALRTYKIVRRPADGLSYAISIAEKYGLTYDILKERIRS